LHRDLLSSQELPIHILDRHVCRLEIVI
jgi:hypothetical protein